MLCTELEKCELFTLNLSYLTMLCPVKEFKLMNPGLRQSRVDPFPPPSQKLKASIGWSLSIAIYQRLKSHFHLSV